jgi:hypothetical protein
VTSNDVKKAMAAMTKARDDAIERMAEGHTWEPGRLAKIEDDLAALTRIRDRLMAAESTQAGVKG